MTLDDADAAVGLILWDDHVLLLKRGEGCPHFPGEYCLPGGHRDDGESPLAAAVRETHEETGILIPARRWTWYDRRFASTDRPVQVEVYRTEVSQRLPVTLSYEHDGYLWHPVHEVLPEATTPMTRRIVKGVSQLVG